MKDADATTKSEPQANPGSFNRVTSVTALLASLVSLAVSVSTLVLLVNPNLKPREQVGASISRLEVRKDVDRAHYEKMNFGKEESPLLPDLKGLGLLVLVKVDLHGFQRRTLSAALHLTHKDTQRSIAIVHLCGTVTAAVTTDSLAFRCWIKYPSDRGKFQLSVELDQLELNSNRVLAYPFDPKKAILVDFLSSTAVPIP